VYFIVSAFRKFNADTDMELMDVLKDKAKEITDALDAKGYGVASLKMQQATQPVEGEEV
jgi:hypothetical protein